MTIQMNDEEKKLIRLIKALFPKSKIYLYGSRARGTQKDTSDYDIAVDAGHELTIPEIAQARNILEHLFIPQRIDFVDIHSISSNLKETILKEGIEWAV